jgi:hypothetical protein
VSITDSWSDTIQQLNEDRTQGINEGAISEHDHVLALAWMKKYVDR